MLEEKRFSTKVLNLMKHGVVDTGFGGGRRFRVSLYVPMVYSRLHHSTAVGAVVIATLGLLDAGPRDAWGDVVDVVGSATLRQRRFA